mgnify:CR=1 FL=1
MKSTRIKRLKTLQHLARKHLSVIRLEYEPVDEIWTGDFGLLHVSSYTFNEMLQALYSKVKCELAKPKEE